MTLEQLVAEGRRLERPSIFLRPTGTGPVAAVWYGSDSTEIESSGRRCWLTVDTQYIPGVPSSMAGYLSVFTDEVKYVNGEVELTSFWPNRTGTPLYAHPASVLPPLEAVFAQGSDAVGQWVEGHGWDRVTRYNTAFAGRDIAEAYSDMWMNEYPLYLRSEVYAVLGGWHMLWDDDDWHDLIDEQLVAMTVHGSEPWVEAWRMLTGETKIIQRIT